MTTEELFGVESVFWFVLFGNLLICTPAVIIMYFIIKDDLL